MKFHSTVFIGALATTALCGSLILPAASAAEPQTAQPPTISPAATSSSAAVPQPSAAQQGQQSTANSPVLAAGTSTSANADASSVTSAQPAATAGKTTSSAAKTQSSTSPASSAKPQSVTTKAVTDKSGLTALLAATTKEKLQPLTSGGHASNSTALYDKATPNASDVNKLNAARTSAQQVIDNASATQNDITQAATALQNAFDAVRFIYHYTGVTGTNGARIFDNNGSLIQAHGTGIQRVKTSLLAPADRSIDANGDGSVYVMCGEDKTDRLVAHGVRIYYSDDLYNWVDKGLGFQTYLGDADLANKKNGADATYQRYYNVANMESDPDYTNIYGSDFSAFANDASNYNISNAQQALDKLLWDLKALKGTGTNPTQTSAVFERPKMAYNQATGRWVIWFHSDGPKYGNEDTATYSKAKAGVAISTTSNPAGPYKYLGSFRMSPGNNAGNPGMARDMNLYIDKGKDLNHDGADDAYLIYSSNENRDLTISLLDKTYTKLAKPVAQQQKGTDVAAGDTYNIAATNSKESPAPFKWNGKYYIIYSETTGWAPNENKYTVSSGDNILGPYHEAGTPFIDGSGYEQSHTNSFYTQSSSVIPYDESKGIFLYWGDRWFNPDTGADISQSRYVMTPMRMVNGKVQVLPAADWKTSELPNYQAVDVQTQLPTSTGSMSELMSGLPNTLDVKLGGSETTTNTPVAWDPYFGPDQPTGAVTVTGKLTSLNNARISFTVSVYPKSTVLFMDAGSDPSHESAYYTELKRHATLLGTNAQHSDQAYSAGGWGISSSVGSGNGTDVDKYETDSTDIYATGYWAKAGKTIDYKADLPAGTYTAQAGYKEWWSNKRQTVFTVSDATANKQLAQTTIVPTGSGNATDAQQFTLSEAATVLFSTKSTGGGDPVLSWISVSKVEPDQIVSVTPEPGIISFFDGKAPTLPKQVTVNKGDGSSESKPVTWQNVDSANMPIYTPQTVQGIVDGTSLPAVASVEKIPENLEYFIDVDGGDTGSQNPSASYQSTVKTMASNDETLLNSKPDQVFDASAGTTWGNASTNYAQRNSDSTNPFDYGIYAGKDGTKDTLSYALTLSPGKHTVSIGMHDWWWQTRPTTITYQTADVQQTGKANARTAIVGTQSDPQPFATVTVNNAQTIATGEINISGERDQLVTFTLTSDTGTGPVLSWIAATEAPKGTTPTPPANSNHAPVISGARDTTVAFGTIFNAKAGVSASDAEDGDLTSRIQVSGTVDTSHAGVYTLTYTVTDSAGATATATRKVTVSPAINNGGNNPGNSPSGNKPESPSNGNNKPKDPTNGAHGTANGHTSNLAKTGSTASAVAAAMMTALCMASAITAALALHKRS
ncbi:immunoglobulin-like domain-containing protein [Bifidobacterium sp. ESL0704]|uniref:immunoglobulin-like domain-containing protein n=1 Tax=Bifidobacterium sp. ESL0704 TaxID=2983219 RepID=UPI0023F9F4A7|nr:immunoglobulin-like domain-containing protein [Bifidobacterium sp. ESL0704]WEV52875.1 DUF5011 domain-containing protein [Bifidobacterium sp. ESL0704]